MTLRIPENQDFNLKLLSFLVTQPSYSSTFFMYLVEHIFIYHQIIYVMQLRFVSAPSPSYILPPRVQSDFAKPGWQRGWTCSQNIRTWGRGSTTLEKDRKGSEKGIRSRNKWLLGYNMLNSLQLQYLQLMHAQIYSQNVCLDNSQ